MYSSFSFPRSLHVFNSLPFHLKRDTFCILEERIWSPDLGQPFNLENIGELVVSLMKIWILTIYPCDINGNGLIYDFEIVDNEDDEVILIETLSIRQEGNPKKKH